MQIIQLKLHRHGLGHHAKIPVPYKPVGPIALLPQIVATADVIRRAPFPEPNFLVAGRTSGLRTEVLQSRSNSSSTRQSMAAASASAAALALAPAAIHFPSAVAARTAKPALSVSSRRSKDFHSLGTAISPLRRVHEVVEIEAPRIAVGSVRSAWNPECGPRAELNWLVGFFAGSSVACSPGRRRCRGFVRCSRVYFERRAECGYLFRFILSPFLFLFVNSGFWLVKWGFEGFVLRRRVWSGVAIGAWTGHGLRAVWARENPFWPEVIWLSVRTNIWKAWGFGVGGYWHGPALTRHPCKIGRESI